MSRVGPGLRLELEWRITLFTLVMVPLMIALGFWQLQRADEKAALSAAFTERQQQHPVSLSSLWDSPAAALAYMPVQLRGSFLPQAYFLLDNQVRDGKVGYEVVGVLQLVDTSDAVLVSRGWIAAGADRQELPQVPVVGGPVELTGHVYVAPGTPYLLAEQQLATSWPKRIQAMEMNKLAPPVAALLAGRVFPYPVRIDAGQPGALAVDWQVVNSSPQKHQAYAVQWFAMAAVLALFYLFRSSNLWQLISRSAGENE